MNNTKKIVLLAGSLVVAITVIISAVIYFNNNSYRKQLPAFPDVASLSTPVKEQLTEAQRVAQHDPTAENIGLLGMAYHSNAFYEQAGTCYQVATRKDPSAWIWNYYRGYLHQEMGDSKGAIESFNAVIRENPGVLQAWFYLGLAYQNLNETAKAEEAFKKIADITNARSAAKSVRTTYTPLPISAKFELARIYLSSGRVNEAEKILLGIVKNYHTIGAVYRLLGNVYSVKGDTLLSRKYIVRASDLPQVTTSNDTLIDRLALMSRSSQYLPKQIEEALKSSNPEWATQLFKHAFQYIPNDKYLIAKFIKHLLRIDQGKEIFPYLEKHFADFKSDPKEMISMGAQLYTYGFYAQALPYYLQAKKLQPVSNEVQANLAYCLWKTNQKEMATSLMNELVQRNKTNPAVLASEVDFLFKTGDQAKAKAYLAALRQVAPTDAKALKLQGMVTEMEGNREAALPFYEASFKKDPSDMEVITKYGNILIDKRDYQKAISMLRTALEIHPNESILLERLGTLLISCPDPKLQNIREGLELSERAFYHVSSNMLTLLSAGKNFALGNAMIGDFETASYYMKVTLNIAKNEKVSQDYMDVLLRLESEINKAIKQ